MSHSDTKRIMIDRQGKFSNTFFESPLPVWAILYLIFIVIFFFTIFKSVMY